MTQTYWTVPKEWSGETAFIIGGGPSVRQQKLELLRGRKVMVINTSYQAVPWADFMIFSDPLWWREHRNKIKTFAGRVICLLSSAQDDRLLHMKRRRPPCALDDPSVLSVQHTTMTAAMEACVHLGANRIVLLGADNKFKVEGQTVTHHHDRHPWWNPRLNDSRMGNFAKQRSDLATLVKPLKEKGIEVFNASPGSALNLWPIVPLETCL